MTVTERPGMLSTMTFRAPPAAGPAVIVAAILLLSACAGSAGSKPASSTGERARASTGPGRPATTASPPAGTASRRSSARTAAGTQRSPDQLITVTAASYGATYATLTAYRRSGHAWRQVFGPWTARIGRNGFAPPGGKREGDGRTPSGSFGFEFFFGVLPNPGVRFPYRRIHPYDFWDDDPASARYNEWVDVRHASAGLDPEPMDVPAYDYGAVIGYNTARTPGLGSAIFLHLSIGAATAGCVTLPEPELLPLLRWLNPARSPRIAMGIK